MPPRLARVDKHPLREIQTVRAGPKQLNGGTCQRWLAKCGAVYKGLVLPRFFCASREGPGLCLPTQLPGCNGRNAMRLWGVERRAPFDQTLFARIVLCFWWLIELCRQLRNLSRDFPVKHVSVQRPQPCAYGAYQRRHVSQLATHASCLPPLEIIDAKKTPRLLLGRFAQ
jgi:hypothetical protein